MCYLYKGILNFNSLFEKSEKNLQTVFEEFFIKYFKKLKFTHKQLTPKGYKKGIPDGIIYLNSKKYIFELKYTLASGYDYNKQIIQSICYYLLDPSCKILILASEKYFDYLLIEENIDLINKYKDKLLIYLQDFSPRTIADNIEISDNFIIHHNSIDKDIDLENIFNTINNE